MELTSENFQVVHVIKPCVLVDADYHEQVYWRRDGVPLARGYYVVSWPAGADKRLFNEDAFFRGPFKAREDALSSMRALQARALRIRRWPAVRAEQTSG